MDVREKLLDLIIDAKRTDPETGSFTEYLADHLIANGVTVQEWISVEDRLPEKDGCYIVTACDEGCSAGEGIWYSTVVVVAEYYKGSWTWYDGGSEYSLEGIVTHWMPLPKATETKKTKEE